MSEENRLKYNEILSEIDTLAVSVISLREKYIYLKQLLERICKDQTSNEHIQFPSLFSRIVYVSQKYAISKAVEWKLQNIRIKATFLLRNEQNLVSQSQYKSAADTIIYFAAAVYGIKETDESVEDSVHSQVALNEIPDKLRVLVLEIDTEQKLLVCQSDWVIDQLIVRYDVEKTNDAFNKTIEKLWVGAQLNLIDSKQEKETGCIIPQFIVLEPDYLIDASALAECFQGYGKSHLHYFRKKFEPVPNSKYILMGNLANFFLDELVYAENPMEVNFQDTFLKAFKQYPFEFTSCDDIKEKGDFFEFMSRARIQFDNIQRVVCEDFPINNIETGRCTLEPSFFCEKFGFQGRLDLLQLPEKEDETYKIIELKSGGLPFPKEDTGKIALNHETQTAIYRLIIQSVFGKQARNISSMILYSAAENPTENLRLSAPYRTLEKEIINVRNLIVATEHHMYLGENDAVESVYKAMCDNQSYGNIPAFFSEKLVGLEKTMYNLSALEKKYFYRYVSFLSRELYIQKIGDESYFSNSGTATLWNTEFRERQDSFDLISDLKIAEIDDSGNDMKIRFERTSTTDFVNFRKGEICIVYPREKETDTVISNQILKGTVAEINAKDILVRFRYKQKNKTYLTIYQSWVIEHDWLDHTYNAMFKNLYSFLLSPVDKKSIILGVTEPKSTYKSSHKINHEQTIDEKRETIINKALSAEDYFLIVGPPGTGKTSVFAKRLIEEFYNKPDCDILVIAYTNRAVDELCEAINQAFDCEDGMCDNYIRVGTELSCNPRYRHRLLQHISRTAKSRNELREIIHHQRIYVGTLASITGKPELFGLKKFDVAVIDEASQILEPQLIGLLSKIGKFIMIGDHNQLSTITLQDKSKSLVDDVDLNNIELDDCRESYFERIFRICFKNNWTHAYDTLIYQGRMHDEIADFPNTHFYQNQLHPILEWQSEPLKWNVCDENNPYSKIICEKRAMFFSNNKLNTNFLNDKISEGEADIVKELSKAIISLYKENNEDFDPGKSLGIITPYRNQIALIKHKLEETGISELNNVMVDTVERYQGSQRDIIILSFCMNKPYQLDFFANLNREKNVDRKLNVAITRARKQLFLVGNEYILRQNEIYDKLLNEIEITSGY